MAKQHFTIDDSKMRRKMSEYERLCGKEIKQLTHNAGRICCVELARYTFPLQRAEGEARVGIDMAKIFMVLNTNWFQQVVKSRTILKSGKAKKHNAARVSMFEDSQPLLKTLGEAKAWHRRNKVFRRGRILPPDRKAIVREGVRDQLLKYTQKKVGIAKAGWAAAAKLCKADVRQPLRGIPRWVTRNVARVAGSVRERGSGFNWKVDLTNHVGYVGGGLFQEGLLKERYKDSAIHTARGKFFKMLSHGIKYEMARKAGLR
jgi:hypothetical protein